MPSAVNRNYVSSTLTLSAILLILMLGCATDSKPSLQCRDWYAGLSVRMKLHANMKPVMNKDNKVRVNFWAGCRDHD